MCLNREKWEQRVCLLGTWSFRARLGGNHAHAHAAAAARRGAGARAWAWAYARAQIQPSLVLLNRAT